MWYEKRSYILQRQIIQSLECDQMHFKMDSDRNWNTMQWSQNWCDLWESLLFWSIVKLLNFKQFGAQAFRQVNKVCLTEGQNWSQNMTRLSFFTHCSWLNLLSRYFVSWLYVGSAFVLRHAYRPMMRNSVLSELKVWDIQLYMTVLGAT